MYTNILHCRPFYLFALSYLLPENIGMYRLDLTKSFDYFFSLFAGCLLIAKLSNILWKTIQDYIPNSKKSK